MDQPAAHLTPRARGALLVLVLLCAGLAAALVVRKTSSRGSAGVTPEIPARGPIYLNATTEVARIGVAACAACHEARYASYLETPHSRSLAAIDPARESLPGAYDHAPSGLHYALVEVDGAMRIRESLTLEDGSTALLADHALSYTVGSGAASRAYLAQIDGFLCQAPIHGLASPGAWAMAPGYDGTLSIGFARPAGPVCLGCHAGAVERLDRAVNRVRVHEDAIGCERCHGAGALHDALRRQPGPVAEGEDLTIVHPAHLTREQKLDLCAQCHMDHTLTITNPGKEVSDWRPAMPWTEVQVTYRPKGGWPGMTVVGHVDQLRQSACFRGSQTLNCLTCHDPHARPPGAEAERHAHVNRTCLTCHDACARVPGKDEEAAGAPRDDCVRCHMPRAETDNPHVASTHHRIGLHLTTPEPPAPLSFPELGPLGDVSGVPPLVLQRNLALATLLLSDREPYPPPVFTGLRERAKTLLEAVRAQGLEDPEIDGALARIQCDERKYEEAVDLAHGALARGRDGGLSPERRCDCLAILVDLYLRERRYEEVRPLLEELGRLRRDPNDEGQWITLLRGIGDVAGAVQAARRALEIWPENPDVQYRAASVFGEAGDAEGQERHNRIGQRIHLQQSSGARLVK